MKNGENKNDREKDYKNKNNKRKDDKGNAVKRLTIKNNPSEVVRVEGVCKSFLVGKESIPILDHISLSVMQGEFVSIMGPSGSGKSTLLYLIGGLDKADRGNVYLKGNEISGYPDKEASAIRRKEMGFIFQSYNLIDNLTVEENILLPAMLEGKKGVQVQELMDRLIGIAGLQERRGHTPKQLSGGQQQRTAIIRALINNPDVILADKPTGNLDSKSGTEILELMQRICKKENKTILMVTHSEEAARYGGRIIRLKDGHIEKEEIVVGER